MVFDTETTSLTKPFCYDIGYCIINSEDWDTIDQKHYVIEQIWHNAPLFSTAYYENKRPLYIQGMRKHEIIMDKFGYVMQAMKRDIKKYNIIAAYAYNSPFDDRVLTYNCDWYHVSNPLETIPIYDIKGYANQFITNTQEYKDFCNNHKFYTDSGNYSSSAETVYRYLTSNADFQEDHMGLQDSIIESYILFCAIKNGALLNKEYKPQQIITYDQPRPFTIKINGVPIYDGEYIKKSINYDVYNFTV